MQLHKFFKIFFWLPASVIYLSFRCPPGWTVRTGVAHLYTLFTVQLQRCRYSQPAKFLTVFLCMLFLIAQTKAQTPDTTYVDTVSMLNIDSSSRYEEDSYIDTTEKHIYDTSQNFFNWKNKILMIRIQLKKFSSAHCRIVQYEI